MTREEAIYRLGALHVEHAVTDSRINHLQAFRSQLESEIDSLTAALIAPDKVPPTNDGIGTSPSKD